MLLHTRTQSQCNWWTTYLHKDKKVRNLPFKIFDYLQMIWRITPLSKYGREIHLVEKNITHFLFYFREKQTPYYIFIMCTALKMKINAT